MHSESASSFFYDIPFELISIFEISSSIGPERFFKNKMSNSVEFRPFCLVKRFNGKHGTCLKSAPILLPYNPDSHHPKRAIRKTNSKKKIS